jgi:predicted transcriptional regulator YheO
MQKKSQPMHQKQRNRYSADQRVKARKYYLMGLNLEEISKLLDSCPTRTIEKWQQAEKWTELKNSISIKIRVKELFESGKTYHEIAKLLLISRVTVWRYLKDSKDLGN